VQHREARIGRRGGAAAGAGVQVRAAARAEAAARLPAQRARGQREDDLLVHEGRQVDLVALVVAERQNLEELRLAGRGVSIPKDEFNSVTQIELSAHVVFA